MAAGKNSARPGRRPASPGELDREIAKLDRQVVELCNQRARWSAELARQRPNPESVLGASPPEIAELLAGQKGPLSEHCLRSILRELGAGCQALEAPHRVAFLGPSYTYSHLAAIERFGTSAEAVPVATIAAVFHEVDRGHCQYGVAPIENSTDGRIADTLDMFTRVRLRISGEVQLRIHHNLLSRFPREQIATVYSRPQALSQCRGWLSKHLPAARTIEVDSTATAARLAQETAAAAAIASRQAGVHYGLNTLAEKIEDNAANVTRFAVIGGPQPARTGRDKTSLMFEVEHRPGSLADAIAIFKRNRLNMTWIESFPMPQVEGHYLFFVELDGHAGDARVKRGLESLGKKAVRLEVLGSYPRSAPIES